MKQNKCKYPTTFYYYNFTSRWRYYLERINERIKQKLGLKRKKLNLPDGNMYYADFLQAINDSCEYSDIDLTKFISYYANHSNWVEELWKTVDGDPDKFHAKIVGEEGRKSICANCVFSFSVKYSYDVIYSFLSVVNKNIKCCDYGCANASISFSMLLRDKISFLTMCDIYHEHAEFIKWRIKKYNLENKAVWKDVRSITDYDEYDVVICFDVLEHLKNPTEALKSKLYPMLKKGGLLILQAPWGGQVMGHLDEAIFDFYRNGGRKFLRKNFKKIYAMTSLDISGIWVKK